MSFKTNYKDAAWTGNRLYNISGTGNGQTIEDATTYSQEGDQVGADVFNAIGADLNKHNRVVQTTLTKANWSNAAPYTQTLSITGMKSTDNPIVTIRFAAGDTAAFVRDSKRAFACIDYAVTENGQITFYCIAKKPTEGIKLFISGVSEA